MLKQWKLVIQMPVGLLHWRIPLLLLLLRVRDVSNSFAPSVSFCRSGSLLSSGTASIWYVVSSPPQPEQFILAFSY